MVKYKIDIRQVSGHSMRGYYTSTETSTFILIGFWWGTWLNTRNLSVARCRSREYAAILSKTQIWHKTNKTQLTLTQHTGLNFNPTKINKHIFDCYDCVLLFLSLIFVLMYIYNGVHSPQTFTLSKKNWLQQPLTPVHFWSINYAKHFKLKNRYKFNITYLKMLANTPTIS